MEDAVDLGLKLLRDRESQARRFRKREERDQRKQELLTFGLGLFNQHLANKADSYMENEQVYAAKANQKRNYDAAQLTIKEWNKANAFYGGKDEYFINSIYDNLMKTAQAKYVDLTEGKNPAYVYQAARDEAERMYEDRKDSLQEQYEAAIKIRSPEAFDKALSRNPAPRTVKDWVVNKISGLWSNEPSIRKDQEIEAVIAKSNLNFKDFDDARSALGEAAPISDTVELAKKLSEVELTSPENYNVLSEEDTVISVTQAGKTYNVPVVKTVYKDPYSNRTDTRMVANTPEGQSLLDGQHIAVETRTESSGFGRAETKYDVQLIYKYGKLVEQIRLTPPLAAEINPKNEQFRAAAEAALGEVRDETFDNLERKYVEDTSHTTETYKNDRLAHIANIIEVFDSPYWRSRGLKEDERAKLGALIWKEHIQGAFDGDTVDSDQASFKLGSFRENSDLYVLNAMWAARDPSSLGNIKNEAFQDSLKKSFKDFTSIDPKEQNKLLASLIRNSTDAGKPALAFKDGTLLVDVLKVYKEAGPDAGTNLNAYIELARSKGKGDASTVDVKDKPKDAVVKLPDNLSLVVNDDKEGLVISVVDSSGIAKGLKGSWFDENFSLNMFEGNERQRIQEAIDSRAAKIDALESTILEASPGLKREDIFRKRFNLLRNPATEQTYNDLERILISTDLPGVAISRKVKLNKTRDFYMKYRTVEDQASEPADQVSEPVDQPEVVLTPDEDVTRPTFSEVQENIAEVSGLFGDSEKAKKFLDAVALNESNYGRRKGTYNISTGKQGRGSLGLFQIDEIAFTEVMNRLVGDKPSPRSLRRHTDKINGYLEKHLEKSIDAVTYEDLQKDSVNTLFARLYLMTKEEPLPDYEDMGRYWKKHYNTSAGKGNANTFMDRVETFKLRPKQSILDDRNNRKDLTDAGVTPDVIDRLTQGT